MRTPDQDERPDAGTAGDVLGGGFGTVDQADLNDGYGTTDFYDDDYGDGYGDTVDTDDTYDDGSYDDGSFDDAPGDDGFGTAGDDTFDDASGDSGDGGGEVVPVGDEVSDSEAERILEDLLDDVFGDDADEVVDDLESSTGMDPSEILDAFGDDGLDGGLGVGDVPDGDGGLFENPFDGPGTVDGADFVTGPGFDVDGG